MPRADKSCSRPSALRESRTAVRHHAHLARGVLIASPRAHYERVVDGHAPDLVDASSAQLLGVLDVTRYMFGRTGRRERARQSEDHHALARRLLAHVEAVRSDRAARPLVFDQLEERCVGQLFTCLNHAQSFASMRSTLARRRVAVKNPASCLTAGSAVRRQSPTPLRESEEGNCPCRESRRYAACSPFTRHARAFVRQRCCDNPQRRNESLLVALSPPACAGMPECRTCRRPFPAAPARAKPPYRATCATRPAYPARRNRPCLRATACVAVLQRVR